MISNLRSPIYVQVELTSDCNNRCLYCYNFWKYNKDYKQRQCFSIKELRRVAHTLGENDIFYVTITGGEPFLEKDKLYKFMDFLCEQKIRIMINSNATLITEEDAKRLSKYPIEIFLVSLISFNKRTHNMIAGSNMAFCGALKGISLLQKNGINLAVNMVATKLNYKDVYKTGKWLYNNFGIKNFSATPICPSSSEHRWLELDNQEVFSVLNNLISLHKNLGIKVDILEVLPICIFADNKSSNIREVIKIFSKRMCTAGNTTITIGSDGDIRVCSFDCESYGNIFKEDFKVVWDKMQKWRDNSLLPKECNSCAVVESCGGGCRVNANVKKGNYCELDSLSQGIIKREQNMFFGEIFNDIDINSKFSFQKDIFIRKEKDDIFVVVANSMHFIIINTKGLEILRYLNNVSIFTPREIIKKFILKEDVGKKFFTELFNKGFLIEFNKNIQKGGKIKWLQNFQNQK